MKLRNICLVWLMVMAGCNNAKKNEVAEKAPPVKTDQEAPEKTAFFPVTDFIKGQIVDIKTKGINPIIITNTKGIYDSSWLKKEDFNDVFAPFLSPVIDSANLAGLFTEKKFLDETVNAFTLTYDATGPLPDSVSLQHWDVYIDPELNTVRRIYILKKLPGYKTLQLTWQADKFCRIVSIAGDAKGNDKVEKETTIKWDF